MGNFDAFISLGLLALFYLGTKILARKVKNSYDMRRHIGLRRNIWKIKNLKTSEKLLSSSWQ